MIFFFKVTSQCESIILAEINGGIDGVFADLLNPDRCATSVHVLPLATHRPHTCVFAGTDLRRKVCKQNRKQTEQNVRSPMWKIKLTTASLIHCQQSGVLDIRGNRF